MMPGLGPPFKPGPPRSARDPADVRIGGQEVGGMDVRAAIAGGLVAAALGGSACRSEPAAPTPAAEPAPARTPMDKYTTVRLTADLDGLGAAERRMLVLFIEACRAMDDAFWLQAYGAKQPLLSAIEEPGLRRFAEVNYGPWDRLDGNRPFVAGVGPKPPGAGFYPADMSREELERAAAASPGAAAALESLYTMVRRDERGQLEAVAYHEYFADQVGPAAQKLREAAALAADPAQRRYLELRAEALVTDAYRPSDLAWMDVKDNLVDVVIGPIETYEDQLFGRKAAFEGYVLVKDRAWSERLTRYATLLPDLQRALPVPEVYRREQPGASSDLAAYDVVYYAGDCNAGAKTIAINLPNDEEVQLQKGTRRLQLKNAMRAKFDEILLPIARRLVAEDQLRHVTFDAFFADTMFHEVAHGLGIKNTLTGTQTVRQALREQAAAVEEGKADVLGLYMVTWLHDRGEAAGGSLEDHYVTFLASIFRSVRFGASSAHGRANLARFNFFHEAGAFERDEGTGTYRVRFDRMREAVSALSERLLRLQGDGDHAGVVAFMERYGTVDPVLGQDLAALESARVPVDVVFEQGIDVLGLER
jgi:hypothetical protein